MTKTKDKDAILLKLSCERCESHIASARAILHLYRDEDAQQYAVRDFEHILNLVSKEIKLLSTYLDACIESKEL